MKTAPGTGPNGCGRKYEPLPRKPALPRGVLVAGYYLLMRWLPPSTSPGGRLWRALRGWAAGPLLAQAGDGINIEHGAFLGDGSRISLGSRSSIGINARIHGPVTIGDDVMMAPDVLIYALGHEHSDSSRPMIDQGFIAPRVVTVEDDVWLGARAILLPGVTVGRGSVVGAGAVVSRSVPAFSVAAGNPARVVRRRAADDAPAEPATGADPV